MGHKTYKFHYETAYERIIQYIIQSRQKLWEMFVLYALYLGTCG